MKELKERDLYQDIAAPSQDPGELAADKELERMINDKLGGRRFFIAFERRDNAIKLIFSEDLKSPTKIMNLLVNILAQINTGKYKLE